MAASATSGSSRSAGTTSSNVTCKIEKIVEKDSKSGKIWFADIVYDYRRARDGALALRELSRLIERS